MKKFFEVIKKKWIADTTRLILLVAIIILVYILINVLVGQANLPTFDFTEEKIYSVSDESKELIRDAGYHQRICLDILEKYKEIIGGNNE